MGEKITQFPKRLKLKVSEDDVTGMEKKFLQYLEENASEVLMEKVNTGKKTLRGAVHYCYGRVKEMIEHSMRRGWVGVGVDDDEVYGWVIHFFEEDEIAEPDMPDAPKVKGAKVPGGVKQAKPSSKPAKKKAVKKEKDVAEMVLFSAMGVDL